MSKARKPPVLHALLFGSSGPDSAFRTLFQHNGELLAHEPGRGLRPCPPEWARRALVLRDVDPELILGLRKPAAVEAAPAP